MTSTYALESTWRPLLRDLGVSSTDVLRRASLPEDLLLHPAARLEADDFHRFWQGLEAVLDDTSLPLTLCRAVRGEVFSPPLFAALCSPNLLVAMKRLARYKALVAPMRLMTHEDGDRFSVSLTWPGSHSRPPQSLVLTELLFIVALARMGTRERVHPLEVTTTELPSRREGYADYLGVPLGVGGVHRVVFSHLDALRPFLTSNDRVWSTFEPDLRMRLADLEGSVDVAQRVRATLLDALPGGGVEMADVARRLGMSRRSLQRHLEASGATYTQLLHATRRALAQHYLVTTNLSAAEIAFLLGFEESTSFFRAFRGWTGQTPDRARQHLRAATSGTDARHPQACEST